MRINDMNWTTILIIAVMVAAFLMVPKAGQISAKEAREIFEKGCAGD